MSAIYSDFPESLHGTIQREAYYNARRRGYSEGHELDDWLEGKNAVGFSGWARARTG